MVRKHFQDVSQRVSTPKPLSNFEIGCHGGAVDVVSAVSSITDPALAPLQLMEIAMGATMAMAEGRPENIQAFFSHDSDASQYDAYILSQLVTGITSCQLRVALKDMPKERKSQAISDTKKLLSNDSDADHKGALLTLDSAIKTGAAPLMLKNGSF